MSGTVTIPSGGATKISLTFGNSQNSALASSIAAAIAFVSTRGSNDSGTGNLVVGNVTGQGGVGPAFVANTVVGSVGELIIPVGFTGVVSVGAGDGYSYIVDDSLGADTIFGFPGVSIAAGGGKHTVIDPAAIAIGDTTAGSTNVVTIKGAGDNVAVGNGTNTVTGLASGTISGGTGKNTFDVTGETGGYVINSQGVGGGDTVQAGSQADTINTSGNQAVVFGAGGLLTVDNTGLFTTIVGGAGGETVTTSGAGALVFGGNGPGLTTIVDTNTKGTILNFDDIALKDGAAAITLAGGHAVVFGGNGSIKITDTAANDTVGAFGKSATTITSSNSGEVVFGPAAGGSLVLDASAGSGTTILGGTAASTISGGTDGVYFLNGPADFIAKAGSSNLIAQFPGSGPATISAAATASDTLFGSNGGFDYIGGSGGATVVAADGSSDTASATSGGLVYFSNSGSGTVTAGTGGATILGGTGASPTVVSSVVFTNTGGSLQYSAGVGNEMIDASKSTSNNLFFSTPDFSATGAATIIAGSGNDTLIGSSGAATLTGGAGNDLFEFNTANFGGHDLITDFSASTVTGSDDQLVLFGYNAEYATQSITAAQAVVQQYVPDGKGNGSITLVDGTKITFTGISSGAQLSGHVIST